MDDHVIELVGGAMALLITLVGALLNRSIKSVDDTMKGLSNDHKSLAQGLQEVKIDLSNGAQLREFQDRRIESLEKEKRSLYNAFAAMDRLIYRKLGEGVNLREE